MAESEEETLTRQRKEKKELQAKIQALKKSIPKGKQICFDLIT